MFFNCAPFYNPFLAPFFYQDYGYYDNAYYDDSYDDDYAATPTYYDSNAVTSDSVVAEVQQELANEGYYPTDAIDGIMGPATRSAVAAYQRDHGLAVTGWIDNRLLQSMGIL